MSDLHFIMGDTTKAPGDKAAVAAVRHVESRTVIPPGAGSVIGSPGIRAIAAGPATAS